MQQPILGYGLCECGCGEPTRISERTQPSRGYVRGKPVRFMHGHGAHKGPAGFWRHVPDHLPADACWEWTGKRNKQGYGFQWSGASSHRVALRAHREVYAALVGAIPEGMHVLHRCDNPPCVNPEHLFTGTRSDNMQDMVSKGRAAEQQPEARPVTRDLALTIRRLHETGDIRQYQLARAFEVSRYAVSQIVRRQMWPD